MQTTAPVINSAVFFGIEDVDDALRFLTDWRIARDVDGVSGSRVL